MAFHGPVTFVLEPGDAPALARRLRAGGLELGRAVRTRRIVLDTFDGRLRRRDVRCELVTSGPRATPELWITAERGGPARAIVDDLVRWPDQLPPGPLRDRLADLTGGRAVLPVLEVAARAASGTVRNRDEKVVAGFTIWTGIRSASGTGPALPDLFEVTPVGGHAKAARAVVAIARDAGLASVPGDLVTFVADAAGVDLNGFDSSPDVELDPHMPSIEGVRLVLSRLLATVDATSSGTRQRIDPEFLHDYRIAVRRARTILGEFEKILPGRVVGPARDLFAELGRITGPPRDLDVTLLEWPDHLASLTFEEREALEPVRLAVTHRRDEAYRSMVERLDAAPIVEGLATWRQWLSTDLSPPDEASPLGPVVARRIEKAHRRLVTDGRGITPDAPAERLHDLRKDAKKVRYLAECFASLVPGKPRKRFGARLKALQDNLGDHQDAEVHAHDLRVLAAELPAEVASTEVLLAIGRLVGHLEDRMLSERSAFDDHFAAFDSDATDHALEAMLASLRR